MTMMANLRMFGRATSVTWPRERLPLNISVGQDEGEMAPAEKKPEQITDGFILLYFSEAEMSAGCIWVKMDDDPPMLMIETYAPAGPQ